jgi:hypothetical protein
MKKVNEETMRKVLGGGQYFCYTCNKNVNGVFNFIFKHRLGGK